VCSENAAWHLLTCSSPAFIKVGPTALLLLCTLAAREGPDANGSGGDTRPLSLVLEGRAVVTVELQIYCCTILKGLSQCPCLLISGSAAAGLLGSWVRIPAAAWMSFVSVVCRQVEVSASGWPLLKRHPTECGASECDREVPAVLRPWPARGCRAMKRNYHAGLSFWWSCPGFWSSLLFVDWLMLEVNVMYFRGCQRKPVKVWGTACFIGDRRIRNPKQKCYSPRYSALAV